MELVNRFSGFPLPATTAARSGISLKTAAVETDNNEDTQQQRLRAACQSFEGFMTGELLKAMRQTEASGGGILPTGRAERIFIGQQCEALGEVLARREPLGLGRLLYTAAVASAQNTTQTRHSTGGGSHEDHGVLDEHH